MRKKIIVTFWLAAFFTILLPQTFQLRAQTVKPLFESQEGSFKIAFPVKPTKKVSTIDTAFGKSAMTVYSAATTLSFYGVTFLDFPAPIKDETEQNIRFDMFKETITANFKGTLISETEVALGKHRGKDFVIEGNGLTGVFRILFVEQRVFQLSIVNRGLMSRSSQKIKNALQKRVDDFINSFVITKLPEATSLITELPEDFGLTFENSRLHIGYFGMTAEIPKDWTRLSEEEAELAKELGVLLVQPKNEKEGKILELSRQNTKILFMCLNENDAEAEYHATFSIAVEKVNIPTFLPEAAIKQYVKTTLDKNDKVTKAPSPIKISGVEFFWAESYNSLEKRSTRFYVANIDGIAFQLFMFYDKEEDMRTMTKIIESITFGTKKDKNVY